MRNQKDLQRLLDELLSGAFSDMELLNELTIGFGRRAKRRFGSIQMTRDKKRSHIRINGLFREDFIPEQIISSTIAHELCHYAHGFSSPYPQKYLHPHRGSVIQRELKARGLYALYEYEQTWVKHHWPKVLSSAFPKQIRRKPARRKSARMGVRRRVKKTSFVDLVQEIFQNL